MAQQTKFFAARGGLDLITPAIEQPPGGLIATNNYEAHPRGYGRSDGYERYDGRQSPSTASYWYLNFDAGSAAISEGNTVDGGTSGASGEALINAVVSSGTYGGGNAVGYIVLTNVTGTFVDGEDLEVGAAKKSELNGTAVDRGASNDTDDTTWLRDAMETVRADIGTVTGSGNIRGVWTYNSKTYAFRDNAGATGVDMWESSSSGWSQVALGFRIPFTSGSAEFSTGNTLTGVTSGATATLTNVALQSGSWAAGDAAGYFIMAAATGTFQAEEVNIGAGGNLATIAADKVANTLAAAGKFEFINHNFTGHSGSKKMYGVDGVSMAFEYDGTAFTPIKTGMTADTPNHIAAHKNHLFLSFTGGSVQHGGIGFPYQFTVLTGAAELGIGEEITGMRSDVSGYMVIGGRNSINILKGFDVDDWYVEPWSTESGIIEWTMDKLGEIMFMDDIGVRNLSKARELGDFNLGTLTRKIQPIFEEKRNDGITITASIRSRAKDMYRLFFSDGTGVSIYLGRGLKKPECMAFSLPIVVHTTCSGENSSGDEVLFFGSTDGYIYQLDAGANHDSAEIVAYVRFPFNHVGSPTRNKQWFKATLEVDARPSVALGMTAEFSYAHDDQPPATENSFTVTGGGGFWEEDNWDTFDWSAPVEGLAQSHIDGLGTNVSIAALSEGTYDDPHRIHGLTLHYSMRRLVA
jgi:hypothetical protein